MKPFSPIYLFITRLCGTVVAASNGASTVDFHSDHITGLF